jgi:hypothetical protein
MLTLSFKDFAEPSTDLGEDHEMYVLRNDDDILYVGISVSGIWTRWFNNPSSHMNYYEGGLIVGKFSTVGQMVEQNLPDSLSWKMDLWSVQDGLHFLEVDGNYPGIHMGKEYLITPELRDNSWVSRADIKIIESWFIRLLHPEYNVSENNMLRNEKFYKKYFKFVEK